MRPIRIFAANGGPELAPVLHQFNQYLNDSFADRNAQLKHFTISNDVRQTLEFPNGCKWFNVIGIVEFDSLADAIDWDNHVKTLPGPTTLVDR